MILSSEYLTSFGDNMGICSVALSNVTKSKQIQSTYVQSGFKCMLSLLTIHIKCKFKGHFMNPRKERKKERMKERKDLPYDYEPWLGVL